MLTWILAIVVLAILAVVAIAGLKPNSFKVTRETHVKAPPAKVVALIDDFREWPKWSPWEKMDPAMTRSHSGSASGKGAIYAWSGNKKVGQGRMEILEASPSQVDIDLQFMAPWKAHNKTVFTLVPKDGGTAVNWAMSGSSPFMFKLMGLFMNMDAMIGKDFEAGLANMKQAAETAALTKQ